MNLVKRLKRDSDIQPALILAVAFLTIVLGKVIEMQTGVSRVSDLAPTFAVLGALVSSVSLIKDQVDSTNQINKILIKIRKKMFVLIVVSQPRLYLFMVMNNVYFVKLM